MKQSPFAPVVLTLCALTAFAANSVLCRMALGGRTIDAAAFTSIRLISGAVMLFLLWKLQAKKETPRLVWNWPSAALLFSYAIGFSFAYLALSAGTGALILFGLVQTTMIVAALRMGERPHWLQWCGLLLAVGGLVYLVFPGLSAPPPLQAAAMAGAGISWGLYTLRGRGSRAPLADTAANFLCAVPLAAVVNLFALGSLHLSPKGMLLAVLSGAIASGVGYVVWYAALPHLNATQAATVQLSVPVLAAFGGVVLLSETVTPRLLLAAFCILGGVALGTWAGRRFKKPSGGRQ